eukprot:EG_transcript_14641
MRPAPRVAGGPQATQQRPTAALRPSWPTRTVGPSHNIPQWEAAGARKTFNEILPPSATAALVLCSFSLFSFGVALLFRLWHREPLSIHIVALADPESEVDEEAPPVTVPKEQPTKAPTVRLDKLLSNLGYGSRKAVTEMIKEGRVTVQGQVERDSACKVLLDDSSIRLDGEELDPSPPLTLVMHKPAGWTCSRKGQGPLVYDVLPERWLARDPPLATVGRLDRDTSGLLLFTEDGQLQHRLTSPKTKNKVSKRYFVTLAEPLDGSEAAVFASGRLTLQGEDRPLLPARLEQVSPTTAYVTIEEGRNRQVRRMFTAVRNEVVAMHRERVGGLALPADLAPGEYRILTAAELEAALRR